MYHRTVRLVFSHPYIRNLSYTTEVIQQLLAKADERTRVVVLLLASTGMRIGAIPGLVMKGAEKIAEELGGYAAEKIKGVLSNLETRFSKNKEEAESLQRFVEKPDRSNAAVVKDYLQEELENDKEFAAELGRLLKDVKQAKPDIEVYIKNTTGKIITGIDLEIVEGGEFKTYMEGVQGDNVTGFKAKRVG